MEQGSNSGEWWNLANLLEPARWHV
jgi:hypothetical protein